MSTNYDKPSSTLYHIQDGYSWGYLNTVSVDENGIMSGHFSNGQTEEMYKVGVYKFNSPWGLKRDGGTNFVATDASGAAMLGEAGDRGRGTISQNSLEESNVDMANEFATMIVTQRGYQANTKVITTSDYGPEHAHLGQALACRRIQRLAGRCPAGPGSALFRAPP